MLYEYIHSHAQIQALQARSDEDMCVKLVSLESVCIARESYVLLRPLMESRSWVCPELDLLSVVASLALELHKLEHDLLPQLKVQEARPERGVLEALLLMKNSSIALFDLIKCFKKALGGLLDKDLVSAVVEQLRVVLKDSTVHVLEGYRSIAWFQEKRLPWLLELVTTASVTPVRFSDSE